MSSDASSSAARDPAVNTGGSGTTVPEPSPELLQRAMAVRRASMELGRCSDGERRAALEAMADALAV
ncbi:MAG: hypothetical protein ACKO0M_17000, partial [Cyanobium sp.]